MDILSLKYNPNSSSQRTAVNFIDPTLVLPENIRGTVQDFRRKAIAQIAGNNIAGVMRVKDEFMKEIYTNNKPSMSLAPKDLFTLLKSLF